MSPCGIHEYETPVRWCELCAASIAHERSLKREDAYESKRKAETADPSTREKLRASSTANRHSSPHSRADHAAVLRKKAFKSADAEMRDRSKFLGGRIFGTGR